MGHWMNDEACNKIVPVSLSHHCNSCPILKIGVLVLLLVAMSGMAPNHRRGAWNAVAADQKSNSGACNVNAEDAAGLNVDPSTDVHAVHDYISTIARMLKEEKFEELDCLADRARSTKERFPGGTWKLHELYQGLSSPIQYPVTHATQEDWDILLQRLRRWVAARPKSVTARVALGRVYWGYAGDARGNGYANSVSESGWELYGERTAEAKRILDEASALSTKCPEWYLVMQLVGQNQNWDVAQQRALYAEATKFEPGYYYYARVLANILLPKWSGEPGDTENFVQAAADRIGGDQGDILYFQVAISDAVLCGCNDNPHLSWERIERGFEATEKRYGVSMWNLNRIAYLAAYFGERDPIVADKAMTRIGEQWDEETWKTQEYFDRMKKWASDGAPIRAKILAAQAAAEANMQTPDGPVYKAAFEKPYRQLIQECARVDGGSVTQWEGKFETLTSVGANGTVEDVRIKVARPDPVSMCLYQKLHAFQLEKATPFPPPPKAPYWVKLDLDWADFAPVAAK